MNTSLEKAALPTGAQASSHASPPARLDLAIGGMTCASCVARIERKLGKLDGVRSVGVNLATERPVWITIRRWCGPRS